MARRLAVDDSTWDEVRFINGYAVFLGYLMMGVRGLGVLVITWTTVVLLGGFVSALGKKDFWCLTGIALVQTAGVFNIILEETKCDLVRSGWGLLGSAIAMALKGDTIYTMLLAFFVWVIQTLVLVIILCPVMVLYVSGIYIAAGVGLWRLLQHDFDNDAQGGTHLKPSLQVLYSLAVAQGLLYGYKQIHALGAKVGLAKFVAQQESQSLDKDLVSDYLKDTVKGCDKDPSFAKGRSLVTYAVDLMTTMDIESNAKFINGVKILSAVIWKGQDRMVLAKHQLTRPSCSMSQMIQRLLETMSPRSPYNRIIRGQAAAILSVVASSINLEQHPEWINCISCVLQTFDEEEDTRSQYAEHDSCLPEDYDQGCLLPDYEKIYWHLEAKKTESTVNCRRIWYLTPAAGWLTKAADGGVSRSKTIHDDDDAEAELVSAIIRILQNLSIHQDNCRVIIDTEGLLPRIIAHAHRNPKKNGEHTLWHVVAKESYKLLMQLAAIPREIETEVRDEITTSSEAIIPTIECILDCRTCSIDQKIIFVYSVLHLSVDRKSMKASSGRIFKWIKQLIPHLPNDVENEFFNKMNIRTYSCRLEKKLSSNQELSLQQPVGDIFVDLRKPLEVPGEDNSTKLHAGKILHFLVTYYEKNDEFLKELKGAMVHVMPEVLKEILGLGSPVEDPSQGTDPEKQTSSSQPRTDDEIKIIEKLLQKELKALCWKIQNRWCKDANLIRQLDTIAGEVSSEQGKPKRFRNLVQKDWMN